MPKNYPDSAKRSAQDVDSADDDFAVAILQDRIEDAATRRQMNEQPSRQLTARDLAMLGQQGALN